MKILFYNIFLFFFNTSLRFAAIWNPKAKKWVQGRQKIFTQIESVLQNNSSNIIWFHCASLGEFEQGRPVIEKLKDQYPACKIVLTFFSPSGYENSKNYKGADHIFYLPMDSKQNAKKFLDIIRPRLVVFVKYDLWHYYLEELKKRNIRCLLISAHFRPNHIFFKWYGNFHKKMLAAFTEIFVQNEDSKKLLQPIGISNVIVSGDTRFDRVVSTAERFEPIQPVEEFLGDSKCIVAGSTWKEDEEILAGYIKNYQEPDLKIIIAPHEISGQHLAWLKKLFPPSVFLSEMPSSPTAGKNVLIIDNIGMLSRLYKYSSIAYIGGGFNSSGIHNILEAAVYGKPILFGLHFQKFNEAKILVSEKAAISISNQDEFNKAIRLILSDKKLSAEMSAKSKNYVQENRGATEKILKYIQENRLLTS